MVCARDHRNHGALPAPPPVSIPFPMRTPLTVAVGWSLRTLRSPAHT